MKLYYIKDEYINFLKTIDDKVPDNKKETRPYVGIVLDICGFKYYAPLSSPKIKHINMKNTTDFHKINSGKYGAINLNNMIPVIETELILIDINNISDIKYRRLLQNQYKYIKSDSKNITNKANKLHKIIFTEDPYLTPYDLAVKSRCCDLQKLENEIHKYIKSQAKN